MTIRPRLRLRARLCIQRRRRGAAPGLDAAEGGVAGRELGGAGAVEGVELVEDEGQAGREGGGLRGGGRGGWGWGGRGGEGAVAEEDEEGRGGGDAAPAAEKQQWAMAGHM